MKGEYLCILSGLSPSFAGPTYFAPSTSRDDETTSELSIDELAIAMATEIVDIWGSQADRDTLDIGAVEKIVEASLTLSVTESGDFFWWLEDYLGRQNGWPGNQPEPPDVEDRYFGTAVVIGPSPQRDEIVLRRAENYDTEEQIRRTVVIDNVGGEEQRFQNVNDEPYYGVERGMPFFCWERPYRYFEEWMRYSLPLEGVEAKHFAQRFFRLVDENRPDPRDQFYFSGLPTCVSYGGIERTHWQFGQYQDFFSSARTLATNTAAAIASGARGSDLWPALAGDMGAWMATRPDNWPSKPSTSSAPTIQLQIQSALPTGFHALPTEIVLQILPLVSVADLLALMLVSRGMLALVLPLLNETLWYHVHNGDLRWILPMNSVKREQFPFAQFIAEWLRSHSMRNRHRLWKIYKQYRELWQGMDERLEG
ncbi:hypothetical protein B0H13DRAFT_1889911 [Mycena leptocephala]|nr:hypothetical protein B0H13DRAFT_1889911 [Mycena leptocephala]